MAGNPNLRQLLIPQHLWDAVTALSQEEMTTNPAVIRIAIKEYLERRRKPPAPSSFAKVGQ